jgi:hypothetical protein
VVSFAVCFDMPELKQPLFVGPCRYRQMLPNQNVIGHGFRLADELRLVEA